MSNSNYNWILERVPWADDDNHLPLVLHSDKEVITLGRKIGANDMTCVGPHVSRRHLKFVRFVKLFVFSCFLTVNNLRAVSETGDKGLAWRIIDLGGVVGTYINGEKVEPNVPTKLEDGDIIGIGCPETRSSKENGKETFVYKFVSPQIYADEDKRKTKTCEIQTIVPETLKEIEAVIEYLIETVVDIREVQATVMEEDKNTYSSPLNTFEGRNFN